MHVAAVNTWFKLVSVNLSFPFELAELHPPKLPTAYTPRIDPRWPRRGQQPNQLSHTRGTCKFKFYLFLFEVKL